MVAMLLAYDTQGDVIATLDYCLARDHAGEVVGLIDFEAHERAGGALTDIWTVSDAKGSGTWPEFLGHRAHEFRVERHAGRIVALIHRESGVRRERHQIEGQIAATVPNDAGERDLRHIVGGPARHLALDERGETLAQRPHHGSPAHLPVLSR